MCWLELGHFLSLLDSGSLEAARTGWIWLLIFAKHRTKDVLPRGEAPSPVCVMVGEVRQRGRRRQSTSKTFPSFTAKRHQESSWGLSPHPSGVTQCWSGQGGDPSPSPLPCPARGTLSCPGSCFIWAPWHRPGRFTAGAPLMWAPDKHQEYFRFMTMSARGSGWGGLWAAMFPAAIEAATFLGPASQ